MLFLLVGTIIGFIYGYDTAVLRVLEDTRDAEDAEDTDDLTSKMYEILIGISSGIPIGIFGFVVGTIIWLFVSVPLSILVPQNEVVEEYNLYTFSDSNDYLWLYNSGKNTMARYIVELDVAEFANINPGKSIKDIDLEEVQIHESSGDARIVKHSYVFEEDWYYLLAFISKDSWYEFYIPNGSVTNEHSCNP